ncbi:Endonuclease/exonuclease/phosphatase [Penicillium expansum]|uniref:DNA-(apurinic or apyrimidinic site) endonuclease 2 n=1 Tax=Penicillium expansum TaxID=27334 RepID=A0A0A2JQ15_PENEN|nr:Endonuclease/exonuclease/phosphatase [Penicillium expansum]KGO37306.1 Endonuclease/exonuclease/phosphatase [Penicillium expansum]KGO57527.1 Endonuclease/exonuclease/phosphatase [Penicillium expansum]KGO66076.1 Endonuclease/exonuclease/phosphatase [Penicillium expansum]
MGFRITTWNVNGIRNPFSYEPWRGTRTFESMFDILEADVVILQETKIQRKDLRDDMVLVPGWDWYSGVVVYTRNATCSPIRAEEGITGVLCPPKSSTSFRNLPEEQQIGGYPTSDQLFRPTMTPERPDSEEEQEDVSSVPDITIDAQTLDSEGRCVILEFPAFVLIGVYCPAYRDESRDTFRMDFLNALDSRIRNLIAMGKNVVVAGDINISKQVIDAAHGIEAIRKSTMTEEEFISAPSRRLFNHLISDGVVIGERDKGRENPVLFDVCRSFHPDRTGMYTCWDQKLNARPGNYGSRIDYVLCSLDMQDWFSDSNIQEGLMGSDHCPVYAVIKESVNQPAGEVNIRDILNPPGMFKCGKRQQEYSNECALPASGRLLPEFDIDKRRSIKDMFARNPVSIPAGPANMPTTQVTESTAMHTAFGSTGSAKMGSALIPERDQAPQTVSRKRSQPLPITFAKRSKPAISTSSGGSTSGQKTLTGFFKPKAIDVYETTRSQMVSPRPSTPSPNCKPSEIPREKGKALRINLQPSESQEDTIRKRADTSTELPTASKLVDDTIIDPIVSKEDWSKLFTKKPIPPCDGHQEPCISLTTKKPGMNRGRSFWICPRPLGPSGEKERGTQWRCPTFIWASDWNSPVATQEQ